MTTIIHWLENHMMACWMKAITGVDCPGCGFQRSMILFLQGDFTGSFIQYPGLFPTLLLLIFLVLHLVFKFQKGAKILVVLFIITATTVMGSYVIKMASYEHEKSCEIH